MLGLDANSIHILRLGLFVMSMFVSSALLKIVLRTSVFIIVDCSDVVVNTSCEHITQDEYDLWLSGLPRHSLIVLQSNNYNIPEHVRIAKDLEEFKTQSQLTVLYAGELDLPLYKRFMIIGKK